MGEIITTVEQADEALRLMLQIETAPMIDEPDYDRLLNGCQVGEVWQASTVYVVGVKVLPVTRNGHWFICKVTGTSGATEPTWTKGRESCVTDGDVTWEEYGVERDLWDVQLAAFRGWRLKLDKASCMADVRSEGGSSKAKSQVYNHCKEMMMIHQPIAV